jgi:hypothetical protein
MLSPDPAFSTPEGSNPPPVAPPHPAPPQARRWRYIWCAVCLFALGVAFFWALQVTSGLNSEGQRALAPVSTIWGLHACLGLGLTALIALLSPLQRLLDRNQLVIGLGLAVLGYLACGLAPQTNRIFYDEHIYMQIAQTITHTGRAEYARQANAEHGEFQVTSAWINKQPNGHPYLLSWAYKLGGVSEQTAHTAIRILMGLTVAGVYFALVLVPLTLPAGTPLASALGFIFTPLVLWWGHTVAVEPGTVAAAAACFFAACLHARLRNSTTGETQLVSGLLLAATAAFSAYFRPESMLIYPVAASVLWAADRRALRDPVTWAALALSLALITPNLLHLWSVRTEDWGASDGRRFDFAFIEKNLASNAGYFFQQTLYPLAGTTLALVGAVWLAVRNRWLGVSLGLWFVLSWGIFVLFYAGGYHYGASSRYALVSALPVALLVGIGASALIAALRNHRVVLIAVGVLFALTWIDTLRFVPTLGREANEARADVIFVRQLAATLPPGALILSMNPCIWNVLGRNSAQLDTVEAQIKSELIALVNQYPGGIYLHWDYWMNCEPEFAASGRSLIEATQAEVVARHQADTFHVALFRLDTPYARQAFAGSESLPAKSIEFEAMISGLASAAPQPHSPAPLPPTNPPEYSTHE